MSIPVEAEEADQLAATAAVSLRTMPDGYRAVAALVHDGHTLTGGGKGERADQAMAAARSDLATRLRGEPR